ncbi:MAG TPA: aldehyde dehydrogenase family protein [Balneola sp.]|jgi:aldehyde dehydrogenase (NAD+)|nr:aldehyde dehydrogenase family protein [Balneola sp.]MAO77538.1 aldehyde dehydrogenase family protein [Balneola sp.]MBF63855.1 aldehyde dehydrogenase family protein [Balneola sp.]HAH52402.1 aldehyde dehydrogenase family protein [Balneola sp.]HBZ37381.1 aldehyde dehydrogenase family protein [Balneola sp.]|tara:strand:- start:31862 stop:33370 length:1509 start_codon:yes stop_codon:yes gene_type:complete
MDFLKKLGIEGVNAGTSTGRNYLESKNQITSYTPVDGKTIANVTTTTKEQYEEVVQASQEAFKVWREMPAPQRGEIVRQIGDKLREFKEPLGKLVTYEMGKIYQEGLGEVQEMIDICDFAVGLSRQLYGLTMHSERPNHRMYEQWHPLGTVGIISAFNFPVAVWSWNAMIAAVCGDTMIWKGSEKTPLCGIAIQKIVAKVLKENNLPEGIFCLVTGDREVGEWMTEDERIPLISATGSIRMGKEVAKVVGGRLGKTILELGGNNAIIVSENADIEMAIRATVFGAVGTCGQRCTSTRRLIIHESVYDQFKERLLSIYENVNIGNPLEPDTLVGPMIDQLAVDAMQNALKQVEKEGGKVIFGGEVLDRDGFYVRPAIAEAKNEFDIVQEETFAPILYLIKYKTIDEAMSYHNGVKQGLSSAMFTLNMREAENFLSTHGSDCGIANINIGTSGAEIGGAFGGEKETGGGRESGSDAWKAYMRRQTNTINWSEELPLAQGISFDV